MRRVASKRRPEKHALRLAAHTTVSELAAAALARAYAQLMANAPAALAKQEPEALHQARVALRKLRLYVRLFRSRIGRTKAEETARELRWVFRLLGELRDLQVFARNVLPHASAPKAAADAFRTRIERRTAAAREALRAMAETTRFRDLCNVLQTMEQELTQRRDDDRARPWLRKRLAKQRKRLVLNEKNLPSKNADLHRLRKRAKKLRYTTDLARALGTQHAKRERRFRVALTALQDNLGALNDVQVERALMAKERGQASLRGRLKELLDAEEKAHRVDLPGVYACFVSADPFWD